MTDNPYQKLAHQLCFAVYSTGNALTRAYRPLLEPLGLTYPQYLALLVLWERDGVTVGDIGDRLNLDSGTLTPLLKRLERAGLLERRRSLRDERQVEVHLTSAGRALQEKAAHIPLDLGCMMGLSGEGIAGLRQQLVDMRDRLLVALEGTADRRG